MTLTDAERDVLIILLTFHGVSDDGAMVIYVHPDHIAALESLKERKFVKENGERLANTIHGGVYVDVAFTPLGYMVAKMLHADRHPDQR
jgi:hypothetical protein